MKLKSIILFNSRDETFTVIGYNYAEEEASREVDNLNEQKLPAYSLEQEGSFSSDKDVEVLVNRKMREIKNKTKK